MKRHMKTVWAMAGLAAILAVTGAAAQETESRITVEKTEQGNRVTFVDDLDRKVTVENPQRVAALLGSYADIWFLAGGDVCASADDAWEDFDLPMGEDAINLGMTKELNLEKLFEADPDFVLASCNTQGNMEWQEILDAAGIPTAYFDVSDFEDYLRVLEICTAITGREELYEQNGLAVQDKIAEIKTKSQERIAEAGEAPQVLSLRASSTWLRAKNSRGNVLGTMLKGIGCVNIADEDDTLLETLSMEQIMIQDPEYIFIAQVGDDPEGTQKNIDQYIAENPAWNQLTAVKEGKVYILEKELYTLKPNARWGEAYEKLEQYFSEE